MPASHDYDFSIKIWMEDGEWFVEVLGGTDEKPVVEMYSTSDLEMSLACAWMLIGSYIPKVEKEINHAR